MKRFNDNSKNYKNFIEKMLQVLTNYDDVEGGDGDDDCDNNILICSKNVFGYLTLFDFIILSCFDF